MNADLDTYLRASAARPFAWGDCDCSLWVADWIWQVRGIDPAAPLRGSYSGEDAAMAIIRRAGGLAALAASLAERAGLRETANPRRGDIGVIWTPRQGQVMAIRNVIGWACKSRRRGIAERRFPLVKAWAVA